MISISVILVSLTLPAMNSLLSSRAVGRSIDSVTGIIDRARAEAMSQRTYVYVAFLNSTNSDNNCELKIATLMSPDGMNHLGGNLKQVSKLVSVSNVKFTDYNGLPDSLRSYISSHVPEIGMTNNASYLATGSGFPEITLSGQNFKNAPYFAFAPDGEIVGGDAYNMTFQSQLSVGLAPTRGTLVQTASKDGAVVTIFGGSASLRVTRP